MDASRNVSHDHEGDNRQILIGIIFVLLMFFGTLQNSLVIVTFYAVPRLRTPVNFLIMGCVGLDVGMIVIGYPFIISPCFRGLWDFGDVWCKSYGFCMTVLAVSNISILTAIAVNRYIVIMELSVAKEITKSRSIMIIILCLIYGILWATAPLVGWGSFAMEPNRLTCGPDWRNEDMSVRSYNICLMVAILCIPGLIMFFCYTGIFLKVSFTYTYFLAFVSNS